MTLIKIALFTTLVLMAVEILQVNTEYTKELDKGERKNYTITPIEHNAGLYFEKLKNIRFSPATWKVLIFLNTTSLWPKNQFLTDVINDIENSWICRENTYTCKYENNRVASFKKRLEDLRNTRENVLNLINEVEVVTPADASVLETMRKKRFVPFGFIGSIAKYAFGTLTEDDGEQYLKKIEQLNNGQTELATLARQQAHVVEHELGTTKSRLERLEKAVQQQFEVLTRIRGQYVNIEDNNKGDRLRYRHSINDLSLQMERYINYYL